MKNITNLDVKRHKLGLHKEATIFSVLNIYKESGYKIKLELLSIITVLSHTEKTYKEVINYIFKLEKVDSIEELYRKLSKNELESKILISKERTIIANNNVEHNNESKNLKVQKPNKRNNLAILFFSGIAFLVVSIVLLSKNTEEVKQAPPVEIVELNNKEIVLKDVQGHKFVDVTINSITNTYLLDTGASSTLISVDFINELIKEGFVSRQDDFLGSNYFQIADGTKVKGDIWNLPYVTIGGIKLENVHVVSIKNIRSSDFLLGMSTLKKLGNYTIVPNQNKIIIK